MLSDSDPRDHTLGPQGTPLIDIIPDFIPDFTDVSDQSPCTDETCQWAEYDHTHRSTNRGEAIYMRFP